MPGYVGRHINFFCQFCLICLTGDILGVVINIRAQIGDVICVVDDHLVIGGDIRLVVTHARVDTANFRIQCINLSLIRFTANVGFQCADTGFMIGNVAFVLGSNAIQTVDALRIEIGAVLISVKGGFEAINLRLASRCLCLDSVGVISDGLIALNVINLHLLDIAIDGLSKLRIGLHTLIQCCNVALIGRNTGFVGINFPLNGCIGCTTVGDLFLKGGILTLLVGLQLRFSDKRFGLILQVNNVLTILQRASQCGICLIAIRGDQRVLFAVSGSLLLLIFVVVGSRNEVTLLLLKLRNGCIGVG